MPSTSSPDDMEFDQETDTETETEAEPATRLFWGHEKHEEFQVPQIDVNESGYLADDESDADSSPRKKVDFKPKEIPKSSSLFNSDSDGFEDKAVL